jgi:hypothetical protein
VGLTSADHEKIDTVPECQGEDDQAYEESDRTFWGEFLFVLIVHKRVLKRKQKYPAPFPKDMIALIH